MQKAVSQIIKALGCASSEPKAIQELIWQIEDSVIHDGIMDLVRLSPYAQKTVGTSFVDDEDVGRVVYPSLLDVSFEMSLPYNVGFDWLLARLEVMDTLDLRPDCIERLRQCEHSIALIIAVCTLRDMYRRRKPISDLIREEVGFLDHVEEGADRADVTLVDYQFHAEGDRFMKFLGARVSSNKIKCEFVGRVKLSAYFDLD